MLLKAAINGKRMLEEHPAIPLTPPPASTSSRAGGGCGGGRDSRPPAAVRMVEKASRLTKWRPR
jgi:hypothetical protein